MDRCRLLPDLEARAADPLAPLASVYEERLRRHGAIDFVAMLNLPLQLFARHEAALRVLQDAYAWVLVDEAQDFDPTQWRLVKLLAAMVTLDKNYRSTNRLVQVGNALGELFVRPPRHAVP